VLKMLPLSVVDSKNNSKDTNTVLKKTYMFRSYFSVTSNHPIDVCGRCDVRAATQIIRNMGAPYRLTCKFVTQAV
jgi:hypothetical protein